MAVEPPPSISYLGLPKDDPTGVALDGELSHRFTMDTGIQVKVSPVEDYGDRLKHLKEELKKTTEIPYDVVAIDTVWIGELSDLLLDLTPYFPTTVVDQYYPRLIKNNKFDSKLLAIPWFEDIGLLYYRQDLLEKYAQGQKVDTWKDLERIAWQIQQGEQQGGQRDFIGFAWQGADYEGLTCNALEWIASWGGLDAKDKLLPLDKTIVRTALEHARSWVKESPSEGVENDKEKWGPISKGVKGDREQQSLERFLKGKAAFLRMWPTASAKLLLDDNWHSGNTCAKNEKCFNVFPLPSGNGQNHFSVIGGWQLGVPKNSSHQMEAVEFIRYATGQEVQAWRGRRGAYIPTIIKLRRDDRLKSETHLLYTLIFEDPDIDVEKIRGFPRPSLKEYEKYSKCFSRVVNDALFEDKADNSIETAIEKMQQECRITLK